MCEVAALNNYHPKGLTHTWVAYYEVRILSSQSCINEWNMMEDLESKRRDPELICNEEEVEECIKVKLREIMSQVDLEDVTTRFVRQKLEESLNMSLEKQKRLIGEEMIIIMRQMDAASQIFDYLYLGSEWNASNIEELEKNGVKYILNITREIDNFYPDLFEYCNIREFDVEQAELMKHWDKTYKFIKKAKHHHSKVLVHCKMGVSRSASTVIAFAMKEYGWKLEEAMNYVKTKRSVVNPNKGFRRQLVTYEGILDASKQRHNTLWRSVSESDLTNQQLTLMSDSEETYHNAVDTLNLDYSIEDGSGSRPRSWSPADGPTDILMKARQLATEAESSEEDLEDTLSDFTNLPINPEMDFTIPIPLTIEHLEEYEMSSRSADSLDIDEAFLDYEPEDQNKEVSVISFKEGPVVLLRQKQLKDIDDNISQNTVVTNELSEESDFEDYQSERRQTGFYDVAMLTEPQNPPTLSNDESVDNGYHPDVKLEMALSQYKKNLRIAKLLLLQQKERDNGSNVTVSSTSETRNKKLHQELSRSKSGPKLRPDDFWIKENVLMPKDAEEDESSDQTAVDLSAASMPLIKLDGVCETSTCTDTPILLPTRDCDDTKKTFGTTLQFNNPSSLEDSSEIIIGSTQEVPSLSENEKILKDHEICEDNDNPVSKGTSAKEVGIWQHYDKEAIPWCPGTVKRTTLQMEEKCKEDTPVLEEKGPSDICLELLSNPNCNTNDINAKETEQLKVENDTSRTLLQMDNRTLEDKTVCESEQQTLTPKVLEVKPSEYTAESPQTIETQPRRNSVSVYEIEDIKLEPDIVSRIKNEIEQRERSCSYSDQEDNENKGVQRSSSWRNEKTPNKSRFDRNSARRRTILPVIRPSPSREIMPSPSDVTDIKVLRIKDEPVALPKGQVQKQRKEYEEKDSTSSLNINSREPRSPSPYVEEGIVIRTGSVKKQKEHLETKYGKVSTDSVPKEVTPVLSICQSKESNEIEKNNNLDKLQSSGSASELSPTVEKVISKSPSLYRKRRQIEVIACHMPDVFQDSASSSKTVSDNFHVSMPKREQQQASKPKERATKSKLSKSISVPSDIQNVMLSQHFSDIGAKSVVSRDNRSKTLSAIESDCLKRYENEGIEWNSGTVKQQKTAIEQKTKKEECSKSSSDEKSASLNESKLESPVLERMAASLVDIEQQSISNVQKIKQEIESNKRKFLPKKSLLTNTKSTSLERKHSLGSSSDFHGKRQSIIDATNVGRSSSFKEKSPTVINLHSKSSINTTEKKRSSNLSGVKYETVIASHLPDTSPTSNINSGNMSQKEIVIIPQKETDIELSTQSGKEKSTDSSPMGKKNITLVSPDDFNVKNIVDKFETSPDEQADSDKQKSNIKSKVLHDTRTSCEPPEKVMSAQTRKKGREDRQKFLESETVEVNQKMRKFHGKTHPLAKLPVDSITKN